MRNVTIKIVRPWPAEQPRPPVVRLAPLAPLVRLAPVVRPASANGRRPPAPSKRSA